MSTITRQHIANLIEFNSEGSDCQANAEQWEVHELARIALASLEIDYPETLPCPVMLEPGLRFNKGVPTKTMLGALQRRAEHYAELEAMTPDQRKEHDVGVDELKKMLQRGE